MRAKIFVYFIFRLAALMDHYVYMTCVKVCSNSFMHVCVLLGETVLFRDTVRCHLASIKDQFVTSYNCMKRKIILTKSSMQLP